MDEIMLEFGLLDCSIEKQLNAQGYTLGKYGELFQKMSDGIEWLCIFAMISDSEWSRIRDRYTKQIKKYMKPLKENNNDYNDQKSKRQQKD